MPSSTTRQRKPSRAKADVILIRNSERSTYKRCRQQWYWNFVDLLKPQEEKPALKFGDLIHRTLEQHYPPGVKRKGKPWQIFDKLYMADLKKGMEEFRMFAEDEGWHDARELGNVMMRRYYDAYYEQDQAYEVLASEQVFQIPLVFSPEERVRLREAAGKRVKVMVVGTMDGVWRERSGPKKQREIFIKEYKTTGKAISQVIRGLPLDEQAGTYWTFGPVWLWRTGVLPENVYPSKILYTIMYKSKNIDDRPEDEEGRKLNRDGTVSKKQPPKVIDREPIYRSAGDRAEMYQRVKEEAIEMIGARTGRGVRIIKNPGPLFMPNCLGCAFQGPCELHESGHDFNSMFRALYQNWKPYSAHEMPERW